MVDPVENANEAMQKAHINELMDYFKEPGQISYTKDGIVKLMALYQIALKYEPNNPVAWIIDFERATPIGADFGNEKTRLGNVLISAEIYHKQTQKVDRVKRKGIGQIRRDFST